MASLEALRRACPCGSGSTYDACCGPLHRAERQAGTAEELMRSRYSAYATGALGSSTAVDHLLRTWHPRTRPAEVRLDPGLTWTGLTVVRTEAGGAVDEEGLVEFRAGFRTAERTGELHEVSRFLRRAGRWCYLDGVVG